MGFQENTGFGKKVFFINPPSDFINNIIPALTDQEFEVYKIDNYRYAKDVLRESPDAICFICIDNELNTDQWFNFVASFNTDPVLSSVFLGVMATYPKKVDREHFLLNAVLPAGFIPIHTQKEELIEIFTGILNLNDAKGRRKFVRADCTSDKMAVASTLVKDTPFNLSICNISSVGMACAINNAHLAAFPQNALIRDITLNLLTKRVKCNAVILKILPGENTSQLVFLFTKGLPYQAKSTIQEYVRIFLQRQIEAVRAKYQPDLTDYSKRVISEDIEEAFLIDDCAEDYIDHDFESRKRQFYLRERF